MKSNLPNFKWQIGLAVLVFGTIGGCGLLNKPPVISSLEAEKDCLCVAESCQIRAVAYDPDGDELSYHWSASGGNISGQGATALWTAPLSPETYTISVKVMDSRGGEAEMVLSLGVIPNTPPEIESLTAEQMRANPGESVVIDCLAFDADGDSLTYSWSATEGSFYRDGPITAWLAPVALGTYTLTVEVTDGKGGMASSELSIEVLPNQPPVIDSLNADQMEVIYGRSTGIRCLASDPDGDTVTYVWIAAEGELSGEGPEVIWTAPDKCGEYVAITVTVIDGRGGMASREINIHVRKPG